MSQDVRLELLRHLAELTEQQLNAAKKLQGQTMFDLNARRSDVLFSLRVALQEPMPDDQVLRSALATEARRVRRLEARLTHVASFVLQTLDRIAPPMANPPIYAASGQLAV
ncbi:MAG: hypothetical protein ACI9MC_002531 [Kiritimatiellia bacterium]